VLLASFLCVAAAPPPPLPKDTLPLTLVVDKVPRGLDSTRPVPAGNPIESARVELGRKLFFDPLLSRDRTVACASCHDPARGFASGDAVAIGIEGKKGRRNAPSLLNRAFATSLFWDGREPTLEAQALKPIEDALEMGNTVAEAVKRLRADREYPARFKSVFGEEPAAANLAKALAAFQRTLLIGGSRIDAFRAGEVTQVSEQERHGFWLWESKAGCWRCHSGSNFTDEQFHNTGVGWGKEPLDTGRAGVTRNESDRGKFKTPSLRGVAWTAPFMHDGSVATIEEVVEFYNRGGRANPNLDAAVKPLELSPQEVQSLVAFLKALSEGDGPTGKLKLPAESAKERKSSP